MNPYAQNNPYIMQAQGLDQQGLNPVFQNIAQQQANQNAMIAQQNQLVNQASGVGGGGSGMNPMAMAMALRNKKPESNESAAKMNSFGAYMPWNQMSTANQYGTDPYSQQSLMLASQDLGMK